MLRRDISGMHNILANKLNLTKEVSRKLSIMGGATGLPLNILCRISFSISLNERMPPPNNEPTNIEKDIAKHTLLGDFEVLVTSLLKLRLHEWGVESYTDEEFNLYFMNTVYRGVDIIFPRIKSIQSLLDLI